MLISICGRWTDLTLRSQEGQPEQSMQEYGREGSRCLLSACNDLGWVFVLAPASVYTQDLVDQAQSTFKLPFEYGLASSVLVSPPGPPGGTIHQPVDGSGGWIMRNSH